VHRLREVHAAGRELVVGAHQQDLLRLGQPFDRRARLEQLIDRLLDIGQDRGAQPRVRRLRRGARDRRPDGVEEVVETRCRRVRLPRLERGLDDAAALVAHHDEERRVKPIGAVLKRREHGPVGHVCSRAHDEQIAEPGMKDDFGRHARIGTRQHRRER